MLAGAAREYSHPHRIHPTLFLGGGGVRTLFVLNTSVLFELTLRLRDLALLFLLLFQRFRLTSSNMYSNPDLIQTS